MVRVKSFAAAATVLAGSIASAQTFQRLGTCPTLGCIFPPDQVDFLAGQYFDIRLEVHAPVNGSEANGLLPDEHFTFTIAKVDSKQPAQDVTKFFNITDPELERWNFTWYEGMLRQAIECAWILD